MSNKVINIIIKQYDKYTGNSEMKHLFFSFLPDYGWLKLVYRSDNDVQDIGIILSNKQLLKLANDIINTIGGNENE